MSRTAVRVERGGAGADPLRPTVTNSPSQHRLSSHLCTLLLSLMLHSNQKEGWPSVQVEVCASQGADWTLSGSTSTLILCFRRLPLFCRTQPRTSLQDAHLRPSQSSRRARDPNSAAVDRRACPSRQTPRRCSWADCSLPSLRQQACRFSSWYPVFRRRAIRGYVHKFSEAEEVEFRAWFDENGMRLPEGVDEQDE